MKLFLILVLYLFSFSLMASEKATQVKISYLETEDTNLTIKELDSKNFLELKNNSISKGFNFHDFWIKITFPKHSKLENQILYVNNPTLDSVEFYKNNELLQRTGDHKIDKYKNNIAYAFPLETDSHNVYYIKLQTQNGLFTKFCFDKPNMHQKRNDLEKMFLTFFFGFILSLIVYNSFLFVTLREKVYFYYIAFQISIFMLLLSYSGLGYYLIWHGNYHLNEFIYQRFEILALFFALIFAQTFLNIKRYSIKLNILINFTLLELIYIVLTPLDYHAFMLQFTLIQTVLLGLVMIVYALIKKVENANVFFMATFFILIGTLVTFLKIFGFLEVNFFTTWSVYIGSMIEATLFSIALANKINALKKREQVLLTQQKELLEVEVKKQTFSLKSTLKEKEVLLKEINHRVKNNLQIISSFISLSSVYCQDEKVLLSLQQRVQAISILYNSLYRPDSNSNVNMKIYIQHICDEIYKIYTPNIELNIEVNNLTLNFDKAIIVGLLVNEIITNMITHAFDDTQNAQIKLSLIKRNHHYILKIIDNGKGFDSEKSYKSLGLKLIKRLSEKQLKGQLLVESNHKGSSFMVTF